MEKLTEKPITGKLSLNLNEYFFPRDSEGKYLVQFDRNLKKGLYTADPNTRKALLYCLYFNILSLIAVIICYFSR